MLRSEHPSSSSTWCSAWTSAALGRMVLRLLGGLDRSRGSPAVVALDAPGAALAARRLGRPAGHTAPRRWGAPPASTPSWWCGSPPCSGARARTSCTPTTRPRTSTGRWPRASPGSRGWGGLAGVAAARVVHTKHGRNEPDHPRRVLLNRLASALCDRVVAVSDDAAAVALGIERVRADKVVTIGNGVPTGELRPLGATARRAASRSRRAASAASMRGVRVARLAAVKDHATLLDAFARLRTRRPDAHLTLVGDGPEQRLAGAARPPLGLDHADHLRRRARDAALAPARPARRGRRAGARAPEGIVAHNARKPPACRRCTDRHAPRVGGNAEVVVAEDRPRYPAARTLAAAARRGRSRRSPGGPDLAARWARPGARAWSAGSAWNGWRAPTPSSTRKSWESRMRRRGASSA